MSSRSNTKASVFPFSQERVASDTAKYNRLFGGIPVSFTQRVHDMPLLLRRMAGDLLDPARSLALLHNVRILFCVSSAALSTFLSGFTDRRFPGAANDCSESQAPSRAPQHVLQLCPLSIGSLTWGFLGWACSLAVPSTNRKTFVGMFSSFVLWPAIQRYSFKSFTREEGSSE